MHSNRYPARNVPFTRPDNRRPRVKLPPNVKRIHRPANDNIPGRVARAAKRNLYRRYSRAALIAGVVLTAYELGRLVYEHLEEQGWMRTAPGGYRFHSYCERPTPIVGPMGWSAFSYPCGAAASASFPDTEPNWGVAPWAYFWAEWKPIDPSLDRYAVREYWERVSSDPTPPYVLPPIPQFVPHPEILPLPQPARLPIRRTPWDDPDDFQRPRGDLKFPRWRNPKRKPEEEPDPDDDPNKQPRPEPLPSRPGKGEKEIKRGGTKGLRAALGWALSTYSEAGDLVDALHDALPDHLQVKGPLHKKVEALWKNANEIDMQEAVQNIIQEAQEDRVWGKQFDKMQKEFEKYGVELPDLRGASGGSILWSF